jgi:hypothetical protein
MNSLTHILFEDIDQKYNVGPVYHGGNWSGTLPIRVVGKGALGTGAYFSPDKSYAERYAKESGGNVIETYLDIKNPLKIYMNKGEFKHPCIDALIQLGMKPEKAEKLVERVEELKGYMGKEIQNLALTKGYDGIFEYFNGDLKEIVVWKSDQVKLATITN